MANAFQIAKQSLAASLSSGKRLCIQQSFVSKSEDNFMEGENEEEIQDFLPIHSWDYYSRNDTEPGFTTYLEATSQWVEKIQQVIGTKKTFEEMKEHLTSLLSERREFVKYAYSHCP